MAFLLSLSLFLSFRPFGTVKEEVEKIACALPAAACVSNVSYNFSYFLSRLPAVLFACVFLRHTYLRDAAEISYSTCSSRSLRSFALFFCKKKTTEILLEGRKKKISRSLFVASLQIALV